MTHGTPRRRLLGLALAGIVVMHAAPARPQATASALGRADWQAIHKAIAAQLAALRADDAERAFGFAAAGIREQVGDAQSFLAMVKSGYGALLVARYTEFLEGAVIDGAVIQPLRLIAPDNSVRVALYTMQKDGARWRIAGCVIAPSTVRAA